MEKARISSVGLDFDDVLSATFMTMVKRTQGAANRLGRTPPTEREIKEHYDYADRTAARLFPGLDIEEFMAVYRSLQIPYGIVSGAKAALQFVARHDLPRWMFTGGSFARVESWLGQYNLPDFDYIITREITAPYRKPDREAWHIARERLQENGIDPSMSLYIDDHLGNYLQAKQLGFHALLLLGSPNSDGYQRDIAESDLLPSLARLPEFLKNNYDLKR